MTALAPSPALLAWSPSAAAMLLQLGAGAALLGGAALLWRALAPRPLLAPPRCARCGHDLRTFGDPPAHCVECNADLARDDAMAFDRRVVGRSKAFIGVALCLLAGVAWLEGGRRDRLARLAATGPSWQGGSFAAAPPPPPATLEALKRSASAPDDRVWTELRTLLRAPGFEPSQLDVVIAALADRGGAGTLRLDMDDRWRLDDAGWGMLAVASPAQGRALADAWVGPVVVRAPERVLPGSRATIRLLAEESSPTQRRVHTPAGLAQPSSPFVAAIQVLGLRVDGVEMDVSGELPAGEYATVELVAPERSGPLEVQIDVLRALFRRDQVPYFGLGDDPQAWPRPLVEQRLVIRAPVEVVPSGARLRSRTSDPRIFELVRGALVVRQAMMERHGDAGRLRVEVGIAPPDQGPRITGRTAPFAVAGRVRVRLGERWLDGPMLLVWSTGNGLGQQGGGAFTVPLARGEAPTTIDIRVDPVDDDPSLRPPDDRPIWGEPIEFFGVPVQRRPETPAAPSSPGADPRL